MFFRRFFAKHVKWIAEILSYTKIAAELGQNFAELDQNSVELAEILPELETIKLWRVFLKSQTVFPKGQINSVAKVFKFRFSFVIIYDGKFLLKIAEILS